MNTQTSWPERLTAAVAAEIRRHRKARGMSAQDLSDACKNLGLDLPRSTLADLENGRRASVSVAELLVLAAALDVPPLLLIFPVGNAAEVELLPGEQRNTWRSAQWFSGEAPMPRGAVDDGVFTLLAPPVTGPAAALPLYRDADEAAKMEYRAASRVSDSRNMTAQEVAAVEDARAFAYGVGSRLNEQAKANDLRPPWPVDGMTYV